MKRPSSKCLSFLEEEVRPVHDLRIHPNLTQGSMIFLALLKSALRGSEEDEVSQVYLRALNRPPPIVLPNFEEKLRPIHT